MLKLSQYLEPCGLPLIACERKKLRTGKNLDLSSVMMANADPAHVGRDHTVRCNDNAVWTQKCDNNSHPRKTLLAFISGYLL